MTCPGDTPLHSAIRNFVEDDENPVKIILENGDSDINVRNSEGETPLLLAVRNEKCSLKLIKLLLKHGADVKATSPRDGNTALHLAVIMLNHVENIEWSIVAKVLLKYGSDAHARNFEGSTPLHLAAEVGTFYASFLMLRLRHVSDVNARNSNGDTPLHLYMRNDKVSSYNKRRFLKNAGDVNFLVNVVNSKGETPLLLAVRSRMCDLELIKKLLELGADVSMADSTGENAYQAFCSAILNEDNNSRREDILMSQTILQGNLQQQISSSLHVACLFLNVESVRNLLRMGADVNDLDPFDRAPLFYAITYSSTPNNEDSDNQCSTVALILDYGADVNQRCDHPITFLESSILLHPARHNLPTESSNLLLNVRDIFIQHAAKLLALQEKQVERGIDVQLLNERNRWFLDTYDKFGETGYKEWLSCCYEELQAMSETKIDGSTVTFFNLLVASAKKATMYAKNEELVKAFHAKKAMFPMYRGMLEAQIDKAIERRRLIDSATVLLSDVLEFGLSTDEFYERTLSYCSNQDLMHLIG